MQHSFKILVLVLCSVALFAASKKNGIPDGYELIHTGSKFSNVIFEFHDAAGKAWPMFFDGKTEGEVRYVHGSSPRSSFTVKAHTLSMKNGDQSRKILGELVISEQKEVTRKGKTSLRTVVTAPEVTAKLTAAGAITESTRTVMKKGKERSETVRHLPTKVALTVAGKTVHFDAKTTLGARARDGKVGTVQWDTRGTIKASELGLQAFSDAVITVRIATSLYPPRQKKKKR